MTSGRFQVSQTSGFANMSIALAGPRGTGTLYVVGTKSAGQWRFSTLLVEIQETHQRIDLNRP
jgi:cytochrome oxidase complex assembly protein 1